MQYLQLKRYVGDCPILFYYYIVVVPIEMQNQKYEFIAFIYNRMKN